MPSTIPKPFAFVLMPFHADFNDTYKLGIKPACEEAGYYCERIDEQIYEGTILERIYNQIGKADLVIADMTGRNPNVFYETGYAHALGKRVVLLTKNGDDIPFDLKHHFHIIYSEGISYLKEKLSERVRHYLLNPLETTTDPFGIISILANGNPLPLNGSQTTITTIPNWVEIAIGLKAVPIKLSVHLKEGVVNEELEIAFRLITSKVFPDCYGEHADVYSKIEMLDGRLLHKPPRFLKLSPDDPESLEFRLFTSDQTVTRGSYSEVITLRAISRGLTRDIPFNLFCDYHG